MLELLSTALLFISPLHSKNISQYIMDAQEDLYQNDQNLGYSLNTNGHTRSLYYNGQQIFKNKNGKSHCVGATFQVLIQAFNAYYKDTSDKNVWNVPVEWMRWQPFKRCWYVDDAIDCRGAGDALTRYGMGKIVTFTQAKPGDFVNYDRTNGSGHSVLFLAYLDDEGNQLLQYDADRVVGFRYFSSQGSTNGIARKNAYFSGFCPSSASDCGIIQSSLVLGRVDEPRNFKHQNGFIEDNLPQYDPNNMLRFNDFP